MSDLEKARTLFQKAGLAFPNIPEKLAAKLKERSEWEFSTRKLDMSPYILDDFVREAEETVVKNYAILAHSGHGINSYAIQYYLVQGALRIFLFLGWGGAYMDAKKSAAQIRRCFLLADEIVALVPTANKLRTGHLTAVVSDFYGSYWSGPGTRRKRKSTSEKRPAEVLAEVLRWLKRETRSVGSSTTVRGDR